MKKSNKCFSFIIVCCVLLTFACETPNVQRDNDFQIADKYFETRPGELEYMYSINQMNNQKFLDLVKDVGNPNRYDEVREEWLLKEKHFTPWATDNYGQSALMWACWNGDYQMAKLLIETTPKKKDNKITRDHINHPSKNGYTALFCSAYCGDDMTMRLLFKHGAKLSSSQKDNNGENLLHKMAKSGKASNMHLILYDEKYGINSGYRVHWQNMFYEQDKGGFTPFHYAIMKNDSQMVNMLLDFERELKLLNNKDKRCVVNIPAMLGNQSVYPLYTAFKLRNQNIFECLLLQKELDINITFPDEIPEHADKDLEKISVKSFGFEEESKDEALKFKSIYEKNSFEQMFENRLYWDGVSELVIAPKDVLDKRNQIIEIVENKNNSWTWIEAEKELIKLKKELGNDIHVIARDSEHDLLELAVISKTWNLQNKKHLIEWILDKGRGYASKHHDNDIFYYCLNNASEANDYLEIVKYLIENKSVYGSSYDFIKNDPYVLLMTRPYVRKNLGKLRFEDGNGIIHYLNLMKPYCSFEEHAWDFNIQCAVLAENGKPDAYSKDLFDYFYPQCEEKQLVGGIPLCTWCYRKGFLYGVEKILGDLEMAEYLDIKDAKDATNRKKKLIDYLNEDKIKNEKLIALYEKFVQEQEAKKEAAKKSASEKKKGTQGISSNSLVTID